MIKKTIKTNSNWDFEFPEQSGKLIAVEGNFSGQLASLLKTTMGVEVASKILKYDGRPFSPEYILKNFEKSR